MGIFDFIKPRQMSDLQQQVYEKGICASCHKKTMRFVHSGAGMEFWQCTACKTVAVLPENRTENSNG